jgi:hypothetical protein
MLSFQRRYPLEYSSDGLTAPPQQVSLAKYGGWDDNSCQVRPSSAFQYGNELQRLSCAPSRPSSIMTAGSDHDGRLA